MLTRTEFLFDYTREHLEVYDKINIIFTVTQSKYILKIYIKDMYIAFYDRERDYLCVQLFNESDLDGLYEEYLLEYKQLEEERKDEIKLAVYGAKAKIILEQLKK